MPGKVEFILCNNLPTLLQQRHLLIIEYAWAPPQFSGYFRLSHITGFGQWTLSERTCHFHAEKG